MFDVLFILLFIINRWNRSDDIVESKVSNDFSYQRQVASREYIIGS